MATDLKKQAAALAMHGLDAGLRLAARAGCVAFMWTWRARRWLQETAKG